MERSNIFDAEDARELEFSGKSGALGAPRFVAPIRDFHCADELGRSFFDARIEPVSDPSLRVQWLRDGTSLANANRIQVGQNSSCSFLGYLFCFQTVHQFGYASLTIHPTYPEDEGRISCVLRNNFGEATCDAQLTVVAPERLQLHTLHDSALPHIENIESFAVSRSRRVYRRIVRLLTCFRFTLARCPPIDPKNLAASKRLALCSSLTAKPRRSKTKMCILRRELVSRRMRCFQNTHTFLAPATDVKMHVSWLKDGAPLGMANRIRPHFDFGYVALDINGVRPEDGGLYTMLCANELGSVESSITLNVLGADTLYLESQHPEGLERISQLEEPKNFGIAQVPDRECVGAPQFVGDIQDVELNEDEDLFFELKARTTS